MTEIDDKKPKVANRVKVLALMTFALTLWQLFLTLYGGLINAFSTNDYFQSFCFGTLVPSLLYVVAGVTMWPAGPGHWNRIAALLTVALLTNILLISLLQLRLQTIGILGGSYTESRGVLTMLVVALVGGFLILLGALWQKRSIEQGK